MNDDPLGRFGRWLTLWVSIAIVAGVMLGELIPAVPEALARAEVAGVSIPVAILIWLMILPMMVRVDFSAVSRVRGEPAGLVITSLMNWVIKPFSMFAIAWVFLLVVWQPFLDEAIAREYLAGAILLGAAPCTAMVFVWSLLVRGDSGYTLVQVATNDLIMLVAFGPIVVLLLDISDVDVPWSTVAVSVVLYIVIPLIIGWVIRVGTTARRGRDWFDTTLLPALAPLTPTGLIITLVVLFSFQGGVILDNPLHIALIAVPLVVQTVAVYGVTYRVMRWRRVRHDVAAPGALIGASNFFELAVATAIALFGLGSGAALATVVGVLVEVPVMLLLVEHAKRTRHHFVTTEPTVAPSSAS